MSEERAHTYLYEVDMNILGLSDEAKKPLLRSGVETVGDVIDVMIRLQAPVGACDGFPRGLSQHIPEIEQKLKEHGYEKFYRA